MVLGVRLQVLRQLPDARRRERDLDFGRTRVLLSSPVLDDHFALDFSLFCQTEEGLYRPFDDRLTPRIRLSRRNEGPHLPATLLARRSRWRPRDPKSDAAAASARSS